MSTRKKPLSFAEFSGIRRRRRNDQRQKYANEESDVKEGDEFRPGPLTNVGIAMQSQEVQTVLLIITACDLVSAVGLLLLGLIENRDDYFSVNQFETMLGYASVVTSIVHFIELLVIAAAFGYEFVTHFGYLADSVALFFSLRSMLAGVTPLTRLFTFVRIWRIVRIVNVVMEEMEEDHEETRQKLRDAEEALELQKIQTKEMEREVGRQMEQLSRTNEMHSAQDNEVLMLREALEIAARSMAQVQGYTGFDLSNYYEAEEERLKAGILEEEKPSVALVIEEDGTTRKVDPTDEAFAEARSGSEAGAEAEAEPGK